MDLNELMERLADAEPLPDRPTADDYKARFVSVGMDEREAGHWAQILTGAGETQPDGRRIRF